MILPYFTDTDNAIPCLFYQYLKTLLLCKNRSVRKGITLLIRKNFADLSLDIQSLWNDKIETDKKKFHY